jgi:transposase
LEIGIDMSKWRSAKAFCSWLRLCPGNKIRGGKVLDSRTRQVVNRVADALRLAAQSAARTETCLGIFYRRKQAHLGAPNATTATARKLACLIYHRLKYKQPYQNLTQPSTNFDSKNPRSLNYKGRLLL